MCPPLPHKGLADPNIAQRWLPAPAYRPQPLPTPTPVLLLLMAPRQAPREQGLSCWLLAGCEPMWASCCQGQ